MRAVLAVQDAQAVSGGYVPRQQDLPLGMRKVRHMQDAARDDAWSVHYQLRAEVGAQRLFSVLAVQHGLPRAPRSQPVRETAPACDDEKLAASPYRRM